MCQRPQHEVDFVSPRGETVERETGNGFQKRKSRHKGTTPNTNSYPTVSWGTKKEPPNVDTITGG